MHAFANPARFTRLADKILPVSFWLSIILFAVGLYWGLVISPPDYQQGDSVRILYVHVPSAWMAMFTYMVIAVSSFVALVWKHPLALIAARAAAPIGAVFTALSLITGSLWGKPMWGTFWVWDGRLTSVLVLLFLYLGYMALWSSMEDEEKAGKATSILALVGVINIPIIKFSVEYWATLHQPASVLRLDGPTIADEMLWPLLIMALAYKAFFVTQHLSRIKMEIDRRKVRALSTRQLMPKVQNAASGHTEQEPV